MRRRCEGGERRSVPSGSDRRYRRRGGGRACRPAKFHSASPPFPLAPQAWLGPAVPPASDKRLVSAVPVTAFDDQRDIARLVTRIEYPTDHRPYLPVLRQLPVLTLHYAGAEDGVAD